MTPLISPDNDFAVWGVLLTISALGFWADTTAWGRRVSGVIIAIIIALVLANIGVIPKAAPAYDTVWSFLVPLAIPLLLFKANLRRILRETGPTLLAFIIGAAGTLAGAFLGYSVLDLGEHAGQLTGIFTATYTGGSMNFAAVAEALEFSDPTLLSASVAADNLAGTLFLIILIALPSLAWARRWLPSKIIEEAEKSSGAAHEMAPETTSLNLLHLSAALALSLVICTISEYLAGWLGQPSYSIIFITALALLFANLLPRLAARIEGDYEAGMLAMYVFFAAIGAGADVAAMLDSALSIFVFALIILTVHLGFLLVLGRLFKLDLAELMVASNACILGPATAAAMAGGRGWHSLVTPGILCGTLGYAIATFLGVSLAGFLG